MVIGKGIPQTMTSEPSIDEELCSVEEATGRDVSILRYTPRVSTVWPATGLDAATLMSLFKFLYCVSCIISPVYVSKS